MSIPAQGRRSVLFPPPGVKIRRTIETLWLPDEATMIAEHDSKRVLLIVVVNGESFPSISFAGSKPGLATKVQVGLGYPFEFHFIGPEEVWAQMTLGYQGGGDNILIQSVFYD